jgi:DNA-nicking Smr family endonuclease
MSNDDLADEEKDLFRRMMRDVKPLTSKNNKTSSVRSFKQTVSPKPKPDVSSTLDDHLSNHYPQQVGAEDVLAYGKASIQHKRWLQLKNGQIPWQARLDLHGLRPDDARNALCRFIQQEVAYEHRCILIIHGKGGRQGEVPILKNHVNHWLQQLPQILAFHSALGKDGGTGAVYVLLRRAKV